MLDPDCLLIDHTPSLTTRSSSFVVICFVLLCQSVCLYLSHCPVQLTTYVTVCLSICLSFLLSGSLFQLTVYTISLPIYFLFCLLTPSPRSIIIIFFFLFSSHRPPYTQSLYPSPHPHSKQPSNHPRHDGPSRHIRGLISFRSRRTRFSNPLSDRRHGYKLSRCFFPRRHNSQRHDFPSSRP